MKKKKRIIAALLTTLMVLGSTLTAVAADNMITFSGDAEAFVKDVQAADFGTILPGESKDVSFTLENDAAEQLKFYMSAEILDNIAKAVAANQNATAVFDFEIFKNNAAEPFFKAVIGSGQNAYNVSAGEEYMDSDNNILLAQLARGETTDLVLRFTLDGDSTNNEYMSTAGEFKLIFSVETVNPDEATVKTTYKKVTRYLRGVSRSVKTGDPGAIALVSIVALSFLSIVFLIVMKRRKKDAERR